MTYHEIATQLIEKVLKATQFVEHTHIEQVVAQAQIVQGQVLAEETGECIAELRRWLGYGRTKGSRDRVFEELADVIISANVLFVLLGSELQLEWYVNAKLFEIRKRGGL